MRLGRHEIERTTRTGHKGWIYLLNPSPDYLWDGDTGTEFRDLLSLCGAIIGLEKEEASMSHDAWGEALYCLIESLTADEVEFNRARHEGGTSYGGDPNRYADRHKDAIGDRVLEIHAAPTKPRRLNHYVSPAESREDRADRMEEQREVDDRHCGRG